MRLPAAPLLCCLAVAVAACGLAPTAGGDHVPGSQSPTASPSPALPPSPSQLPTTSPSPSPASPVPGPLTPNPSPTSGQVLGSATNAAGWTAVVTNGPDGQLQETLTVVGPLTVLGGCVRTLTAWAETAAGAPLPTPTPSPTTHCLAIALVVIPAGSSRAFTAVLPEPTPPGTYAIHAALDTQGPSGSPVPVVTVSP